MTDAIIKTLRELPNRRGYESNDEAQERRQKEREAGADALEAQARRIAGYQKDADDYLIRLDELNALRARIAELEAALRPFADKADKAEGPFEPPYPVDYSLWRAARAALGEK